jgi:hypothetical protein
MGRMDDLVPHLVKQLDIIKQRAGLQSLSKCDHVIARLVKRLKRHSIRKARTNHSAVQLDHQAT